MNPRTGTAIRRLAIAVAWVARVAGTVLLFRHWRLGVDEIGQLTTVGTTYGDRIFSVGFLAMLLGLVIGWLNLRAAAALLIAGYVLAAGAPFLGTCVRPDMARTPSGVALFLLPFVIVGIAYAYAGRTRAAFA